MVFRDGSIDRMLARSRLESLGAVVIPHSNPRRGYRRGLFGVVSAADGEEIQKRDAVILRILNGTREIQLKVVLTTSAGLLSFPGGK